MRTARLAAAALLALVLAGCSGDNPKPAPLPTPAPSASSEPTPPTMPSQAQRRDTTAVEAFIRHWINVFNYAGATGDTDELAALSSPHCKSCSSLIAKIEELYGAGGYAKGEGWSVQSLQVSDPANVAGKIRVSVQESAPSEGAPVEHFDGGMVNLSIALLLRPDGWLMLRLDER